MLTDTLRSVTLKLMNDTWVVQFHDGSPVAEVFGTPFVETPFRAWHDPEWVLVEVLLVLDDCLITLERPSIF